MSLCLWEAADLWDVTQADFSVAKSPSLPCAEGQRLPLPKYSGEKKADSRGVKKLAYLSTTATLKMDPGPQQPL